MKKIAMLLIAMMVISVGFLSGCSERTAVEQQNKLPTVSCSANPTSGTVPLDVNFVGSGSDADGVITQYYWDFGDGDSSSQQNPTHTFQSAGTFTVTLTVKDDKDAGRTTTQQIIVYEAPLNNNPTCSLNVNTDSGNAPLIVTFLLNADDEDGSISFWELDINNDGIAEYSDSGVPPSGQQHTYSDHGTYTAKFIVTDNEGATNYDTVVINVNAPPPEPIILSGSGDDVTSSFFLNNGIAIFHIEHTQGHNTYFGIWLFNVDKGTQEELLVNTAGNYQGSTLVGIGTFLGPSQGRYVLNVEAGGNWYVTIEQPVSVSSQKIPLTLSGQGSNVPSPFEIESGKGAVKFKINHDGSGYFGITLYDSEGNMVDLLVNTVGSYEGSKVVAASGWMGASPGIHYLKIEADGNWQIEISYV